MIFLLTNRDHGEERKIIFNASGGNLRVKAASLAVTREVQCH